LLVDGYKENIKVPWRKSGEKYKGFSGHKKKTTFGLFLMI
jgi:hypothetical protein